MYEKQNLKTPDDEALKQAESDRFMLFMISNQTHVFLLRIFLLF